MTLFLSPDWPAPRQVRALTTLRRGQDLQDPFAHFNLATHVGDIPDRVHANRQQLQTLLGFSQQPLWLQQVHGTTAVCLDTVVAEGVCADAALTHRSGPVCAVLTADCLPILLCDTLGQGVAAIHAGWRGLSQGIIESTLTHLQISPSRLLAWLGPAIGPKAFTVGQDVWDAFGTDAEQTFIRLGPGQYRADLYQLARLRLQRCGVSAIYGGQYCTYHEPDRFYSYRRTPTCGRMASLIWLDP